MTQLDDTTTAATTSTTPVPDGAWRDPARPLDERVDALIGAMTLDEKLAQLYGVWIGASDDGHADVAPHQHDLNDDIDLDAILPAGLGQVTRPFGTAPVDAAVGALSLIRMQERIVAANRFGIPAIAHEECLAGFAAWGATAYPVPLSWGATFDPALVERMAQRIGADMRSVGVHQGLAPVLDVVRDARWGRVEETIGEDPYLVATVGRQPPARPPKDRFGHFPGIRSRVRRGCSQFFIVHGLSNTVRIVVHRIFSNRAHFCRSNTSERVMIPVIRLKSSISSAGAF
jgi:beta-xylosidase